MWGIQKWVLAWRGGGLILRWGKRTSFCPPKRGPSCPSTMELPPSPFFQKGWHCPSCCRPKRSGTHSHAPRRMGVGKRGGRQPWLPAQLHPSLGMARGWRQGRAARLGLGRLAEQLSLHRAGLRPLRAVNYANIGKCVERTHSAPVGLRMLCVIPCLLSRASRKQAAEASGAVVGYGCACPYVAPAIGHGVSCPQVTTGWGGCGAPCRDLWPCRCLDAHHNPLFPWQTSTMVRTSTTPRATRSPKRCQRARKPCPTSTSRPPCPPSSAPAARRAGTVSHPPPPTASAQG